MNSKRLLLLVCTLLMIQLAYAEDSQITVFYTGKLFGYMRTVPKAASSGAAVDKMCPHVPSQYWCDIDSVNDWPSTLRRQREGQSDDTLLLGMGDNLGPKYEARFDYVCQSGTCKWKQKSRNQPISNANDDSVADFLLKAGYDAVIPWKEDFYFGAYRLQQIAQALHKEKEPHPEMLGANLIVQAVDMKPVERGSSQRNYSNESDVIKPKYTDLLPFATHLSFEITPPPGTQAKQSVTNIYVCPAQRSPDDYGLVIQNGHVVSPRCTAVMVNGRPLHETTTREVVQVCDPGPKCVDFSAAAPQFSQIQISTAIFNTLGPTAGRDYGLCFSSSVVTRPYCAALHFSEPFLNASPPYLLRCNPDPDKPCTGKNDVVVFGVVESEMKSYLARLNDSWEYTGTPGLRYEVSVLPAEVALQQALDRFEQDHPKFEGFKILMAQMPQAKAEELAVHFTKLDNNQTSKPIFDLVLAKAEDGHASASEYIRVSRNGIGRTPILVPRPISNPDGLVNPLSAVTISRNDVSKAYCNSASWDENDVCKDEMQLAAALKGAAPHKTTGTPPDLANLLVANDPVHPHCSRPKGNLTPTEIQSRFEQCVLESMLVWGNADMALLQKRDFYLPKYESLGLNGSTVKVQAVLDKILWKGDLLTTAVLTGAQIKQLLKSSEKIENDENNPTSIRDTRDQGLVEAGLLSFEKRKAFYINADNLDDKQIYKVVTSDHLALSDTGYPEIASPAVQTEDPVFHNGKAFLISEVVCRSLGATCCHSSVTTQERIVEGNPAVAPLQNREAGAFAGLKEWWQGFTSGGPFDKPDRLQEEELESSHYVEVTLNNLSAGFTLHDPHISDVEVAQKFTGVALSQASQFHSSELTFGGKLRALWRNWSLPLRGLNLALDVGVEPRIDYDRSRQGNVKANADGTIAPAPDSLNYPKNNFTIGPVLQIHRHVFQPHWMGVLRPVEFGIEISQNRFRLDPTPEPIKESRVKTLRNKIGMRYEKDANTYLETGGQFGQSSDVLAALIVNPGTADSHVCDLSTPQFTIQSCAQQFAKPNSNPPQQQLGTFHESGMYWDGQLTLPLPIPKFSLKYVLTLKGDLFANRGRSGGRTNNETASQTRYDVTFGHGFKLPLYGNFSLQPKFEWFYYENKIVESFLRKRNFDIQLTYDFSRKSRVGLLQRMQYDASGSQ